jgi:hypothetical protein
MRSFTMMRLGRTPSSRMAPPERPTGEACRRYSSAASPEAGDDIQHGIRNNEDGCDVEQFHGSEPPEAGSNIFHASTRWAAAPHAPHVL